MLLVIKGRFYLSEEKRASTREDIYCGSENRKKDNSKTELLDELTLKDSLLPGNSKHVDKTDVQELAKAKEIDPQKLYGYNLKNEGRAEKGSRRKKH